MNTVSVITNTSLFKYITPELLYSITRVLTNIGRGCLSDFSATGNMVGEAGLLCTSS